VCDNREIERPLLIFVSDIHLTDRLHRDAGRRRRDAFGDRFQIK
jgi:hypothetical protein